MDCTVALTESPPPGRVRLWTADPDAYDDAGLADCAAVLSAEERERLARYRFDRDRRMYIAAHALLRRALSSFAPVEPAAWRFRSGPHGRPELAEPLVSPPLRFSISHTPGLVACVVAGDEPVGVDVELVRETPPLDVAGSHYSPEEQAQLAALAGEHQARHFYLLWTLKEAYLKACGAGLSQPLEAVSFEFGGDGIRLANAPAELAADCWHFGVAAVGARHQLSVALRTSGTLQLVPSGIA